MLNVVAVALAEVFVGVTGGVPAVLAEIGCVTLVGYGDGVPFGSCGAMGVGAESDVGEGVGAQR